MAQLLQLYPITTTDAIDNQKEPTKNIDPGHVTSKQKSFQEVQRNGIQVLVGLFLEGQSLWYSQTENETVITPNLINSITTSSLEFSFSSLRPTWTKETFFYHKTEGRKEATSSTEWWGL